MAIVQRGSKVYASIKDLPVVTTLSDGMKFIMQADEGTVLIDYSDMSVDLDHTTFGQTFMDMVNLTGTIESFVNEVDAKISDFQNTIDNMEKSVKQNTNDIEALKYFIRLISLGPNEDGKADEEDAKETLGEDSEAFLAWQNIYNNIVKASDDTFYNDYNLAN